MKHSIYILGAILAFFCFAACEDLEETYDDFVGDGPVRRVPGRCLGGGREEEARPERPVRRMTARKNRLYVESCCDAVTS